MRLVGEEDREDVVDFMFAHAPILMFPLSNLTRYGMSGGHRHAMQVWITRTRGKITDIMTISEEGVVFPCCPSADWAAARRVLAGRQIKGILGDGDQVAALRKAAGLSERARFDVVEPSYMLNLSELSVPPVGECCLRALHSVSTPDLVVWRAAYLHETLEMPADEAVQTAETDVAAYLESDNYRVLHDGDQPVAMTGFNAAMPEIVQIGGVYTPPPLRSRGYGRLAVALHLTEAAVEGVTQAVLSAANPAAETAYKAIGFVPAGSFSIAIFDTPREVDHG